MAEQHTRCRFWPRCAVHLGRARESVRQKFSDDDISDMVEDRDRGWEWHELAELWGTTPQYACQLVRQYRLGVRRAVTTTKAP